MTHRIVAGCIGLLFGLQAVHWLLRPAAAAEALGMPLLDGVGRSTQIGDIGAFFLALGVMCGLGAWRSNPTWLRGAALLLGGAAVMRTLAWALQGAAFTAPFIGVEVVSAALLLFVATRIEAAGA